MRIAEITNDAKETVQVAINNIDANLFGVNKMDESVSNTQMGLLIDDSTKPTSANVSMAFYD